jgi:hypothetical protein
MTFPVERSSSNKPRINPWITSLADEEYKFRSENFVSFIPIKRSFMMVITCTHRGHSSSRRLIDTADVLDVYVHLQVTKRNAVEEGDMGDKAEVKTPA